MRLKDKVALITGGAQGIGKAIAETLGKEGAHLALWDVNEESVKKTAQDLASQLNIKTLGDKVDVTRNEAVENGMKRIIDTFGKIDILVNNAGITKDNLMIRMGDAECEVGDQRQDDRAPVAPARRNDQRDAGCEKPRAGVDGQVFVERRIRADEAWVESRELGEPARRIDHGPQAGDQLRNRQRAKQQSSPQG